MRILMTTIKGEGHLRPLLPFADAFRERGHEILIGIPESGTGSALDAGHEVWALPQAADAEINAVSARAHAAAASEVANRIILGELFAGTHARAAIPGVMAAVAEWLPDVILHESCEFAGALTAERAGLPSIRVAVHHAALEEMIAQLAARDVDGLRAEHDLAPDPEGERLRGRSITLTPPALDGHRLEGHYREPPVGLQPPPGSWDGDERPLVYLSYGTVAPQGDAYPGLYRDAIEQLADLDVRVLLNTGRRDPAELGPLPRGVHAEAWVHEPAVLPYVAAMVSHGGAGSVRTALSAGVPLAVLPRFGDQPLNARAVEETGAGLAIATAGQLRRAVSALLSEPAYAGIATGIAAEVAGLPPAGEAIDVLCDALATFAV